jgi:endonuclease/exonuclease/phosphatase family metal-dependent hydrolase
MIKLISLNFWNGNFYEQAIDFFKKEAFDVLCLQEVTSYPVENRFGSLERLKKHLGEENYKFFYSPTCKVENNSESFFRGNLIASRLELRNMKMLFLYKEFSVLKDDDEPRNVQMAEFVFRGKRFTVLNTHYPALNDDILKLDISRNILDFLLEGSSRDMPVIICGDFNSPLNSDQINIFEEAGFLNLCRIHNVKTTRNIFATGYGGVDDYIFTKNLEHKHFEVKKIDVSDHYPLVLNM